MPSALDIVDAIDRVRQRLRDSDDADDRLVAGGLFDVRRGRSFTEGVELAEGWLRVVRQRDQAAAMAAIAATLAPGTVHSLSQQIAARLSRYYDHAWLRDSVTRERPDGRDGLLFDYLSAGGPLSAEAIRRGPLVKIFADLTNKTRAA